MKLVNNKYIITDCDYSYNYIRKWDVETGQMLAATMNKNLVSVDMMETFNNRYLATYSSNDKKIKEWDIINWKFIKEIELENKIDSICIDPYGNIICIEQQGIIRTREPSGKVIRTYKVFSRYDHMPLFCIT